MTSLKQSRAPRRTALTTAAVVAGCALVGFAVFVTTGATPALAAPTPQAAPSEFPDDWFYPDPKTRQRYAQPMELEGKKAPEIKLKDWVGKPVSLDDMKGKVVVVDFWATWCRPCVFALPKNVEMVRKFGKDGLVVLGIHDAKRGSDRMEAVAKKNKLNYSTAVDDGGVSARAWKVRFWPTYAVIDHKGIVRASGLRPERVQNVVEVLLEERKRDMDR